MESFKVILYCVVLCPLTLNLSPQTHSKLATQQGKKFIYVLVSYFIKILMKHIKCMHEQVG